MGSSCPRPAAARRARFTAQDLLRLPRPLHLLPATDSAVSVTVWSFLRPSYVLLALLRRPPGPICSSSSVASPASSTRWVLLPRKRERTGFGGGRLPLTKVVLEAMKEIYTKRIDPSQEKRQIGWQKAANWDTPVPIMKLSLAQSLHLLQKV